MPLGRLVPTLLLLAAGLAACGDDGAAVAASRATTPATAVPASASPIATEAPTPPPAPTAEASPTSTAAPATPTPTPPGSATTATDSDERLCEAVPETTTVVKPLPPWSADSERFLEVEFVRSDSSQPQAKTNTVTPTTVRVEEALDDGWQLLWESVPTLFDGLAIPRVARLQLEQFQRDLPLQRVAYRIDNDRIWLGVDNGAEIRKTNDQTLDAFKTLYEAGDEMWEVVASNQQFFEQLPDENYALIFAQETQLLHALEGIELGIDDVLEAPDELPNPFGGAPLPAWATIQILDLVDSDGCVSIQLRVDLDAPQALHSMMESISQAFATPMDEEGLAAAAAEIEIESVVVGQYDVGSGFFRRVTETRQVSDGSVRLRETTIITDVTLD